MGKPVREDGYTRLISALEARAKAVGIDLAKDTENSAERGKAITETLNELERSYDITLEVFGDALELRGFDSRGHSKRVTAYTIALARFMGLSSSQIRVIARASFMHDIGTMATPERILHQRDRLTSEEQAQLRERCRTGYKKCSARFRILWRPLKLFTRTRSSSMAFDSLVD